MNDSGEQPRFHVITVLHNDAHWIESCLASVYAQSLAPWKVTVVDNASRDGGSDLVEKYWPQAHLLRSPVNLGFAGGNNRAAKMEQREHDYILLINPDTILSIKALETLARDFAAHPNVGVLGCKLLERDIETIQHVGLEFRGNGLPSHLGKGERDEGQYSGVFDVQAVTGAAMAVRTRLWRDLDGFDERFYPAYFEEADLCFRARQLGSLIAVSCDTTVTHFDSAAGERRSEDYLQMFFRGRGLFLRKHYSIPDWLLRFFPDEIRWMRDWESQGKRGIAFRSLMQAWTGRNWPKAPVGLPGGKLH